jgi:hypothetical protein
MKFYKLGLLTLLISLFILNSCKTQDGIGLDPATPIAGDLIIDTSIVSTTVPEDSVVTNGSATRAPLAFFKDPDFGTTEANIAAVLNLPGSAAYTLPTGTITIDSVRLILPYATDGFYGDSLLSQYKIDVHQLDERILLTKSYYNTKHFSFTPALLGTKTFYARVHDSVQVTNIVTGGPDTLIKIKPHLRIPINPGFINTNFFGASTSVLSSNDIFSNTVKGLYLTLDKTKTPGTGGNIFFGLDSAAVMVYYKRVDGTTIDTTSVSLPLGVNVNEIKHTYTGTKAEAALNGTSTDGLVYLQGLAGLRAKLSFPNVKNILDGKTIINRAELVVKVKPGTTTPFAPSRRLTLYTYDIAHQRINLQDASPTDPRATVFGGSFNPATGEYHFIVTAFMQDLIRGKTTDYGTYLAPVDPIATDVVDITPAATYAERAIIGGKNSPYRIKLNIIYTKLAQ